MGSIRFFSEDIPFKMKQQRAVASWIKQVAHQEGRETGDLNFIFCSDNYLLNINTTYLQHDTYTDIITFDYSEGETIEGDIYISIDRIKENAQSLEVAFEKELHRVIIHGVLHLLGYQDKSEEQKQIMRETEDACLSLR
jgi:probable rRNA maturation factor